MNKITFLVTNGFVKNSNNRRFAVIVDCKDIYGGVKPHISIYSGSGANLVDQVTKVIIHWDTPYNYSASSSDQNACISFKKRKT